MGDSQKHKPYDVWPLFPLLKALTQYQEATGDPRVVPAMLKCCRKIDEVISQSPCIAGRGSAWPTSPSLFTGSTTGPRSPGSWTWRRRRSPRATTARAQFDDFKFTAKTQGKFDLDTHGVNTGMALKYGGVRYRLTGDPKDKDAVFRMLDLLDRHHGQATGIFTCDEHLAGRSPSQGTELCTVVEAMYSLEVLAGVLGDARLGDRLEKLAFNALPATFKKDMTAHQYDQQCNQVICSARGEHVYVSNRPDSNLYGLEPNFGCCTANFHQGWPKFVSHLWMKTPDGGLAVVAYAPCVIETKIQGKPVKVSVETDYPFRSEIGLRVTVPEPMSFPLHLRHPRWRRESRSGTSATPPNRTTSLSFRCRPTPTGVLTSMSLVDGVGPMVSRWISGCRCELYKGDNDAVAITRGPLVFALPIEAEWKKVKDNPQFADWEVYPKSPWNYALQIDPNDLEQSVRFLNRRVGARAVLDPWSPRGRQGQGPAAAGLGPGTERRGSAAAKSRQQRGAARDIDSDPLRLHGSAHHRVSNTGFAVR